MWFYISKDVGSNHAIWLLIYNLVPMDAIYLLSYAVLKF